MTVYEFIGAYIDEKTYVICEGKDVLMIDAIWTQELDEFLESRDPDNVQIILTHEHIDHIYGVNHYRELYNCQVMCSRKCSELITDCKTNFAMYQPIIFENRFIDYDVSGVNADYSCYADTFFDNSIQYEWNSHVVYMKETPGHSKGSICIVVDDKILFTGDSLLLRNKIITKIPGGSKKAYLEITKPYLESIKDDVIVYPGHGESALMKEFSF